MTESIIPAIDWITRLGRETGTFDVKAVIQGEREQASWDFAVTVSIPKPSQGNVDLLVETRSQLTPKTAISIAARRRWLPPDGVLVVCCPFISTRVAEVLREQQIGYIDRAGNCHLAASGLFLHIEGRPNRNTTVSESVDPFSKKSSRIVRTLLSQPSAEWQVQQLAKDAGVSLGLASKVKRTLVEGAYLEERSRLLRLREPAQLLEDWSKVYRPHAAPLHIFAMSKGQQCEKRIAEWCRRHDTPYALTQLAAAWRYSPMVRYDKCVLYFDKATAEAGKLSDLFQFIDAREVDSGANCTLWLTDDAAVFKGAKVFDGVNIVSPIQLYLDLKSLPGRGEEAAGELYDRELRPLFEPAATSHDTEA